MTIDMVSVLGDGRARARASEVSSSERRFEERVSIEAVRSLAPVVEVGRASGERDRHLSAAVVEALRSAGILQMSTSTAVGGSALDEVTAVRVLEELSRQDGSVGWNAMVVSNTATIASYLPASGLQRVYESGPNTVIAGALLPKGQAVAVPGGYLLTGHWSMASGCHYAHWMIACSTVFADGAPRMLADGRPDVRTFFLPIGACQILDTWTTTGLRATGSHDWETSATFVPEELTFPVLYDGPSQPGALMVKDFAAYAVARVAAVALGIARDAIESFITVAKSKTPAAASSTLATQHTTHERLGRAEALLRAARALLYETVNLLPYTPTWSVPLTDEQRVAIRLAGAHAAQSAVEAVDLMFHSAGTSGIYTSSRLDRCFRDVHVAAQHINVAPSNIEMAGQQLLGFDLQFRR